MIGALASERASLSEAIPARGGPVALIGNSPWMPRSLFLILLLSPSFHSSAPSVPSLCWICVCGSFLQTCARECREAAARDWIMRLPRHRCVPASPLSLDLLIKYLVFQLFSSNCVFSFGFLSFLRVEVFSFCWRLCACWLIYAIHWHLWWKKRVFYYSFDNIFKGFIGNCRHFVWLLAAMKIFIIVGHKINFLKNLFY